jgi:hypothetical protein
MEESTAIENDANKKERMELYELHTHLEKLWFAVARNHLASERLVLPGGTNQEDNYNHRADKASSGASGQTSGCT